MHIIFFKFQSLRKLGSEAEIQTSFMIEDCTLLALEGPEQKFKNYGHFVFQISNVEEN